METQNENEDEEKTIPLWQAIVYIIGVVFVIVVSAIGFFHIFFG